MQRLPDAGVNKIILSSHLQNSANERAVVAKIKNVDIVIVRDLGGKVTAAGYPTGGKGRIAITP